MAKVLEYRAHAESEEPVRIIDQRHAQLRSHRGDMSPGSRSVPGVRRETGSVADILESDTDVEHPCYCQSEECAVD